MKYSSFIRYITTTSWMVSPQVASTFFPIFRNTLMGFAFDQEEPIKTERLKVEAARSRKAGSSSSDEKYVAIHTVSGVMLKHDQECGPYGTRTIARNISACDKDKSVIGHILVIDSGGGAANSVPPLADAIEGCSKPVVCAIDGIAASAGIYAASFCEHIIALSDMAMVGCIGTMIEFRDFPTKADLQDGSIYMRIYADPSSEKNSDFEEALKGNVTLIKENLLNPLADRFVADMKKNRPATPEEQLRGRTYFANQVVGTLIDQIGTMDDAVNKVVELANKQEEEESASLNNRNMEFENIEKVPSCQGLVVHEGSATLNQEQLAEIDEALANTSDCGAQEVANLNQQLQTANQTIASRDARIAELEAVIESGPKPAVETAEVENNPHNNSGEEDPEEFIRGIYNKIK